MQATMIWTQALLWLIAGIILGAGVALRFVTLGESVLRLVAIGVCDDPKCETLHVSYIVGDKRDKKRTHADGMMAFVEDNVTKGMLGVRRRAAIGISPPLRTELRRQLELCAAFTRHKETPMDLFEACLGAVLEMLAHQSDADLLRFVHLGDEEGIVVTVSPDDGLRVTHPTADVTQLVQSSKFIAFKLAAEGILERRKTDALAADTAPHEATPPADAPPACDRGCQDHAP